MGEVYRARDPRLGRDVAVKVLPAAFSSDPERMRRFEQEARATAALNHPNILAVYDIGTFEAQPYVVAELLGGAAPRWRHDGKEIFYATPAGRLMAAAVTAQGSTIEVGSVNPLFSFAPYGVRHFYDVAPDGQRFLVNTVAEASSAPITVVLNWAEGLKK